MVMTIAIYTLQTPSRVGHATPPGPKVPFLLLIVQPNQPQVFICTSVLLSKFAKGRNSFQERKKTYLDKPKLCQLFQVQN